MAGAGPVPKKAADRQRRHKNTGERTLTAVTGEAFVPSLPDGTWNPMTVRWWDDIWSSPMAVEWEPSDVHGLFMLAVLVNEFWSGGDSVRLSAEIRIQCQRFGLSPLDRQRLRWETERGEDAASRTTAKRKPKPVSGDPRAIAN